jgi:hypothetical protein
VPGHGGELLRPGDRVVYLWWEHQDQELPFLVVAGATTKDEFAE